MTNDFVTAELDSRNFTIHNIEQDPVSDLLVMTITHDLHPDVEFTVSLVSKDADGNDTMQLQFDGPDDFTNEEAKQVLQEVMDTLVTIIDKAVELEVPINPTNISGGTNVQ